ncbi:hypothetical protein GWI33_012844 [Rhynchophorus ferrugineus]|uniref:Uncharacterized protein n=1 Tax=Rhynchophorus ferrugineus TaxID=354439 RepID=A0A834MC40_RHYFE|nr:hypothetical protein GWI33_012844 [Rhynchophorus ferrugineus]
MVLFQRFSSFLKSYFKRHRVTRNVAYIQGQSPEPKIREYFYYIDHQGMLFLDDARMKNFTSCFKEKKFLRFFFNQIRINSSDRYPEFPYISLCGRERNFVRCDDCPIVFTHVLKHDDEFYLAHNHADVFLKIKFEPEKIFMLPETGRVYHPAYERAGSIGLVRSKLAIEFSHQFKFEDGEGNPPTHFTFFGTTYNLKTDWYYKIKDVA